MDKLLGRLSRCYRPLGSFPQTTSSPPISIRRISIFITPVGPAPLNPRPNSHSSDGLSFKETASRLSLPVSRFRQPSSKSSHKIRAVCLIIDNLPLFNASYNYRGAAAVDYRVSHVSAYLLRAFRFLMPFVQLVNSVPTPLDLPSASPSKICQ
jgi:hypothetical protein